MDPLLFPESIPCPVSHPFAFDAGKLCCDSHLDARDPANRLLDILDTELSGACANYTSCPGMPAAPCTTKISELNGGLSLTNNFPSFLGNVSASEGVCPPSHQFVLANGYFCCSKLVSVGNHFNEYNDGPAWCDVADRISCPALPDSKCKQNSKSELDSKT